MKEIEKTCTVYVSEDGMEFSNKVACLEHERNIKFHTERSEYLSGVCTELLREVDSLKRTEYFVKIDSLSNKTTILGPCVYNRPPNALCEPDEDFDIDYDDWERFKHLVRVRYGFVVNTPSWYWGK